MKKTMIFMLLCAAMATAFTACEKDPAADDPAGQEGNNGNVNENPGGSDGYLVPWETSERLLKTVECSSGEKAEIEYDGMGRPVRIDITTSYGSTQESNLTYEVNAMTITSVEDYGDGEPYEAMLTYTWNNEGYMIDCPIGEPYVSRFEYKDNYLVRCYEDTSIQDADNIWQDGNLMAGYTLLMDGNFTYLGQKNKVNMYFYDMVMSPKLNGHVSENYIKSRSDNWSSSEYEYVFDDEGYVTSMTEHETSKAGSRDLEYSFTYYE